MIKGFFLIMWMNCIHANFEEDMRKFTIFKRDGGYEKVIQILTNLSDSKKSEKKDQENIANDQLVLEDEPLELINSSEMSVNKNFQDQMFEGDIVLTLNQASLLPQLSDQDSRFNRFKRKIINNLTALWPNGIINYDYDASIGEHKKAFIEAAMNHWSVNTCLKFRRLPVGDYLLFVEGSGCYSNVGRIGGKQEISVGKGCEGLGVIAHEIGHALGIWHEQSRPDRDEYININFDNVIASARSNFFKLPSKYLNAYGIIYDLGSVMHYGAKAFTRNGDLATIETLDPNYSHTIGQRNMLSFTDIKQINAAYCSSICQSSPACQNGGYSDPSAYGTRCNVCKCPEGLGGPHCTQMQLSKGNCGSELTATSAWQVFSKFGVDQDCNWLIRTPADRKVRLEFLHLNVQCRLACVNYVEVKYKDNFEQTGARFCCSLPSGPIVSASNEIVVIYRVDTRGLSSSTFTARFIIEGSQQSTRFQFVTNPPISSQSAESAVEPVQNSESWWSPWTSWSRCSSLCGGCGTKKRRRLCIGPDENCQGYHSQDAVCGGAICGHITFGNRVQTFCCPGFEIADGQCQAVKHLQ